MSGAGFPSCSAVGCTAASCSGTRSTATHRSRRPSPDVTLLVDDLGRAARLRRRRAPRRGRAAAAGDPDERWERGRRSAPDRRRSWSRSRRRRSAGRRVETVEAARGPARRGADAGRRRRIARSRTGSSTVDVADDGTLAIARRRRPTSRASAGSSTAATSATPTTTARRPTTGSSTTPLASSIDGRRGRAAPRQPDVVRRATTGRSAVEPTGAARTAATVATDVTTTYELRAGEPFVRVRVEFDEPVARPPRPLARAAARARPTTSAAEGQFAVVERGLTMEGGHGEVPAPDLPGPRLRPRRGRHRSCSTTSPSTSSSTTGASWRSRVLRSFGLISRNANPFREDPAGPEVPVPDAQLIGPWRFSFALMPHAGGWAEAGVLEAAGALPAPAAGGPRHCPRPDRGVRHGHRPCHRGRRRRPQLSPPSRATGWSCAWSPSIASATEAIVRGTFREARVVDLLGREGASLPVEDGSVLRLPLGPWEIATVRLR